LVQVTIGDTGCLDTELVSYLTIIPTDPDATKHYTYVSDGDTFTISTTLSTNVSYVYNTETGWGEVVGPLDAWDYKKTVLITNSGTALTDYQVKLTIPAGAGGCENHCNADFSDLRFATDSGGATQLNYWIESTTTPAVVWVKVPSISGSITNQPVFYMFYGNAEAVTASSGPDTFIHFDDFEGTTTATGGSIYTSVVYAGSKSYGKTDGQAATFTMDSDLTGQVNLSLWMYLTARGFGTSRNIYFYSTTNQYFQLHHRDSDWARNGNYTSFPIHNSSGSYAFTPSMATNAWYKTSLNMNFTTKQASLYVYNAANTLVISRTNQAITNDNLDRIWHSNQADSNTSSPIYYDNLIVRKIVDTEPTSSYGSEQSN
ncbi:MAG: DUF2341 domain-containing protein, partial [Candidatus Paceibacterota bacterium]